MRSLVARVVMVLMLLGSLLILAAAPASAHCVQTPAGSVDSRRDTLRPPAVTTPPSSTVPPTTRAERTARRRGLPRLRFLWFEEIRKLVRR
jgi:hypothetical protein